jgi:hypothetical protein
VLPIVLLGVFFANVLEKTLRDAALIARLTYSVRMQNIMGFCPRQRRRRRLRTLTWFVFWYNIYCTQFITAGYNITKCTIHATYCNIPKFETFPSVLLFFLFFFGFILILLFLLLVAVKAVKAFWTGPKKDKFTFLFLTFVQFCLSPTRSSLIKLLWYLF